MIRKRKRNSSSSENLLTHFGSPEFILGVRNIYCSSRCRGIHILSPCGSRYWHIACRCPDPESLQLFPLLQIHKWCIHSIRHKFLWKILLPSLSILGSVCITLTIPNELISPFSLGNSHEEKWICIIL